MTGEIEEIESFSLLDSKDRGRWRDVRAHPASSMSVSSESSKPKFFLICSWIVTGPGSGSLWKIRVATDTVVTVVTDTVVTDMVVTDTVVTDTVVTDMVLTVVTDTRRCRNRDDQIVGN